MSKSHLLRVGRVLLLLSTILATLHVYIAVRLLPSLPFNDFEMGLSVLFLILSVVAIPCAMAARFAVKNQKMADILAWMGLVPMGFFSSLLVLTFLRDLVLWLSGYFIAINIQQQLEISSAIIVVWVALAATVFGFVTARRLPAVVYVDIPIPNLATGLQGFTIVQISDVHVGPTIKGKYVTGIVNKINALKPQMIAITGDLVDGSVADLAEQVAPLKNLQADYGSFFVTGNHEYYSGAKPWIEFLSTLGLRVLMNEHVILTHNNAQLVVAGVTDFNAHQIEPSHRSDAKAALAKTAQMSAPKIMLAHQPRSAEAVEAAGADLQLSGHTHGGQFWPWNFFVILQQPFTIGLHKYKHLQIYINRGTGYWGPPKRLGSRSEISCIRLVSANVELPTTGH